MKNKVDRRKFILEAGRLGLTLASASLWLPMTSRRALAEPHVRIPPQFFVLISVAGGMDVTLGLDPRTHPRGETQKDVFLEYREHEILKKHQLSLGPAAKSLKPWMDSISIVNGIHMRRDGHTEGRDYLSTGKMDRSVPSIPVALAETLGGGPLGVISSNDEITTTGAQTPIISISDNSKNPASEAASQLYVDSSDLSQLSELLDGNWGFTVAGRSLVNSQKRLQIAKTELAKIQKQIPPPVKDETDPLSNVLQSAHFAATAFAIGASNYANLKISRDPEMDTHSNHERIHLAEQSRVWTKVAEIFSLFKAMPYDDRSSLFDHTTFMVVGEFSRTPYLNQNKGKDHNINTNSVLLAGDGIVGGQTIGASRILTSKLSDVGSLHVGCAIEQSTGNVVLQRTDVQSQVGLIYPEHVVQTVLDIFAERGRFNSLGRNIVSLSKLIKT